MVRESDSRLKGCEFESRVAGIRSGGSECTVLSPPSIPRRGALEQGTNPQHGVTP